MPWKRLYKKLHKGVVRSTLLCPMASDAGEAQNTNKPPADCGPEPKP